MHRVDGRHWCVSEPAGLWEISAQSVGFEGIAGKTVTEPNKMVPDDEDGKPSGWIEVDGTLAIKAGGHVVISPSIRTWV